MSMYPPFSPGQLTKQTAGSSSTALAFSDKLTGEQLYVVNTSATIAVVFALGGSTVVAAATDNTWTPSGAVGAQTVIPAATGRYITRGDATHCAFIRDGGSDATIYINTGAGGA